MKMTSMSRRSTGWQVEGAKRRMEAWRLVLAHSCWGRRYKPDDLCYAAVCRRMPPWDPTNSYVLTLTAGRPQQPLKASILCRLTDFGLRLISYDIIYQWLSRHPQQWTLLRQPPCALQDSRGLPAGRSTAWSRGFPVAFKFAWRRYWKECQRLPVLETLV